MIVRRPVLRVGDVIELAQQILGQTKRHGLVVFHFEMVLYRYIKSTTFYTAFAFL